MSGKNNNKKGGNANQGRKNPTAKYRGRRKRPMSLMHRFLWVTLVVVCFIMKPTAVLLFIGMLPTLASMFSVRKGQRSKAISVGSLNFAGCSPFLFQLWSGNNGLEEALSIVSDPMAVIVMYAAAGIGYILDWVLGGVIGGVSYQRAMSRKNTLETRQEDLIERWGEEVTGELELDRDGFALHQVGGVEAGMVR